MKSLGANISKFDRSLWLDKCKSIAREAIKAKFDQNPILKKDLLETGSKSLIEAAPKDKTWGIGMYLHDPEILLKSKEWGKTFRVNSLWKLETPTALKLMSLIIISVCK